MHRLAPLGLGAFALLVAGVGPVSAAAAAPTQVSIGDFFFKSARMQISPGDTVTWTNGGEVAHTVTGRSGDPERFGSGTLDSGATFSRTFTKPGRYAYICTLHPTQMFGVIQVGPDTTPAKLTKVRAKRGRKSVRLSFRLSEDAKVRITINRSHKVVKTITVKTARQGDRSLVYKPRKLVAGRYSVKLVTTDVAGNPSKAVRASFTVPR